MNNSLKNGFNLLKNTNKLSLFHPQIRNIAARKRFYRKTGILSSDGKYEVTLDQKKLKTPRMSPFVVNSEALAVAIAAEWDAQKTTIQQSSMHLTALCSTVIDNPNNLTKFDIVTHIINNFDSDTILFYANENEDLYEVQLKEWTPIIDWFNKRYNVNIAKSQDIAVPLISAEDKSVISRHLLSYNFAGVIGFNFAVDNLKSVILALACLDRFISVEKAVLLSRLEEEFQLKYWGRVEWAHDLNQQELQARVAAAILFVQLNSSSNFLQKKSALN